MTHFTWLTYPEGIFIGRPLEKEVKKKKEIVSKSRTDYQHAYYEKNKEKKHQYYLKRKQCIST